METAIWSLWWVWLLLALGMALFEVLVPGFVFLGFAIGALAVALILLVTGLAIGLPLLLLMFAALSLLAWLGLRKFFTLPMGRAKFFNHDIND